MNANRLHALLIKLRDDLAATQLHPAMQQLLSALQKLIQQTNADRQTAVGNALKKVYAALDQSEVDEFSPAWTEMIAEIGFADCLGTALRDRLSEEFKGAEMTPTLVRESVEELAKRIAALQTAATQGIAALDALSIGSDELNVGECELGFMIPPASINHRLDEFSKECKEFDLIFGTFSELVTGKRDHYEIKTISSSDFSVFLDSAPIVAAAVATAVERILAGYKKLLEIRKLRSELVDQDVPKSALADVDAHANNHMDALIDTITEQLIDDHGSKHDSGRKNELRNFVRLSLNKVANRIDRGYHIEVRIGELPDEADSENDTDDQLAEHVRTIREAAEALQFINTAGLPVLRLPEAEPNAATQEQSTTAKKKTSRRKTNPKKKSTTTKTKKSRKKKA